MLFRGLSERERKLALELAWKIFLWYEAPDHSKHCIDELNRSIHATQYLSMLLCYGAFIAKDIIGVIATRNSGNHIALFFCGWKIS